MKFLVTGGAGFIGSNFIWYIFHNFEGIEIINLDSLTYAGNLQNLSGIERISNKEYTFVKGDIRDRHLLQSFFSKNNIDYIVNFAAESHVDRSIKTPAIFLETNILGTQALLDTAVKFNIRKFIQISTDEVYGSLGSKGAFSETTPLSPRSPYSASKAGADLLVQAYHHTFNLPINITRCSNNYGPFQFPEKVIPLIINNVLTGRKIPLYGDGKNIRDWLFVDDHCSAIELVIRNGKSGEVYNIGANNEWKNIDMIKMLLSILQEIFLNNPDFASISKTKINNINENLIEFVKDRLGHDRRYAMNSSKIRNELGWNPKFVDFRKGIKKTILWYLTNYDWIKNVTSGEYLNYYSKMYGPS